jgi:hypothetical protein
MKTCGYAVWIEVKWTFDILHPAITVAETSILPSRRRKDINHNSMYNRK